MWGNAQIPVKITGIFGRAGHNGELLKTFQRRNEYIVKYKLL